jgi:23S rRNA (adenine2503-C2)-methyltransferase
MQSVTDKIDIFDLTSRELDEKVVSLGLPKFRAQQLREWVYAKRINDFEKMTNLSKQDRTFLSQHVSVSSATVAKEQHSSDGTIKLLLTWENGSSAETVMIPDADRRTACVSSQVGCPVGCTFCASGINGVKGNLTAGQIVEQVVTLNRVMKGSGFRVQGSGAESSLNPEPRTVNPPTITNIVFMGMGEPLANYANVMKAIRVLHDPACLNLGARRITISTVGVPPKMRELSKEDLPLNLAISLHAPNESLRRQLIPWAEHFTIDEILDAGRYYFDQTGREITLEYILLSGVNDRPEHAAQLAKICRTLRANVNLIRYNEVAGLPYKRPESDDVMNFQAILRNNGVNAHVRKSRGRDIDAACGQLRRKEQLQFIQIGS